MYQDLYTVTDPWRTFSEIETMLHYGLTLIQTCFVHHTSYGVVCVETRPQYILLIKFRKGLYGGIGTEEKYGN